MNWKLKLSILLVEGVTSGDSPYETGKRIGYANQKTSDPRIKALRTHKLLQTLKIHKLKQRMKTGKTKDNLDYVNHMSNKFLLGAVIGSAKRKMEDRPK